MWESPLTETSVSQRSEALDIAKGIALLCVLFSHSTARGLYARQLVMSFHLPVFFFVAGCLFRPIGMMDAIRKALSRYFVPFVFFWGLSFVCDFAFTGSISSITCQFHPRALLTTFVYGEPIPNRSLWFLYSLCLVYLVSVTSDWLFGRIRFFTGYMCVITLAIATFVNGRFSIEHFLPLHLETVPIGLFFFTLGRMSINFLRRLQKASLPIPLYIVVSIVCFCASGAIVFSAAGGLVDMHFGRFSPSAIPAAILGVCGVMAISYVTEKIRGFRTIVAYIGKHSLFFFTTEHAIAMNAFAKISAVTGLPVAVGGGIRGLLITCAKTMFITPFVPFMSRCIKTLRGCLSKMGLKYGE